MVTHSGTFHADDIFATATLSILLKGNINVVRTRDKATFTKADFLYDVGGEHDPALNHFDHHQPGGAGVRANGVPYAAFGLVWQKFGPELCGSAEVAALVDAKIVQPVDANDNGIDTFSIKDPGGLYVIQNLIYAYRPTWKEDPDYDKAFMQCVEIARGVLAREIKRAQDLHEATNLLESLYQGTADKRVVMLDAQYPWKDFMLAKPEPLYVVSQKDGMWRAECVLKERYSFENRKSFPIAWAGLREAELESASGVKGAMFCHNGRFLVVAQTREAILALVQKALLE